MAEKKKNIFSNTQNECNEDDYKKCDMMQRLIASLERYSILMTNKSDYYQDIFLRFIEKEYKIVIDDFIHFKEHHQHQLEEINDDLNKCDIRKCEFTTRHQEVSDPKRTKTESSDPKLSVYERLFDGIHFHLCHCFESGLRIRQNKDTNDDEDEKETKEENNQYVDAEFARYRRTILETRSTTASFPRFSSKNDKYNLMNADNEDTGDMKVESPSFDSFSVGLRFYYWPFYENIKEIPVDKRHVLDVWDHDGSSINELFVKAKYSSFKEELSNYSIDFDAYETEFKPKVNKYLNTSEFIKKTTATANGVRFLYYGIKKGDPIQFDHLLSLVYYTDTTQHSAAFSASFRKKERSESIQSVAERNSVYYWMSRKLRECVEIFGQSSFGDTRYGKRKTLLTGPYYCGVNAVMIVPSFTMRLCGPTSTSKQISVAIQFCGSDGIIIQLDNPRITQHMNLRGFNASFISAFPAEDEVLWFGGWQTIQIQSVRIPSTQQNFQAMFRALYYLDVMLSGQNIYQNNARWNMKLTKTGKKFIKQLIKYALNEVEKKQEAAYEYIYSTFDVFVKSKKQIVFNMNYLTPVPKEVAGLFMNELDDSLIKREDDDVKNLFKPNIFKIFPNVKSITFITGPGGYSLSLIGLLSLIKVGALDECVIKTNKDEWIRDIWKERSETLIEQYNNANYSISFNEVSRATTNEYNVVISKK